MSDKPELDRCPVQPYPLSESNAPPAPKQPPPSPWSHMRNDSLSWRHTCLLCAFACVPLLGEHDGVRCDGTGEGFEISRFLGGGAPTEEPRPDASNARRQRPATRATGVSRAALACVLNTRGCPQAFCTSSVIRPVRVHKYPWQAS
jgi:hypothetical protein